MALTKAVAVLDGWTAVAANTVIEGATVDCAAKYQSVLTVVVALASATAQANGMDIRVQISAATSGDEDWVDFVNFVGPIGTANTEAITNNPLAAGSTTITCASTTGYTLPTGTDNGLRYIKDGTIGNSEIFLQTALTTNTNITALDGTTHEHIQNVAMWNIVGVYVCQVPDSTNRARVVYNNTKDAAGSACDVMSRISSITAI